jgi:hypothetical protein
MGPRKARTSHTTRSNAPAKPSGWSEPAVELTNVLIAQINFRV